MFRPGQLGTAVQIPMTGNESPFATHLYFPSFEDGTLLRVLPPPHGTKSSLSV